MEQQWSSGWGGDEPADDVEGMKTGGERMTDNGKWQGEVEGALHGLEEGAVR